MSHSSPVMVVLRNEGMRDFANQVAHMLGYPYAHVVVGEIRDAIHFLRSSEIRPTYLVIDVGAHGSEVLQDLDAFAEYCPTDARVVVTGDTNDIGFYRALIERGVADYFPHPVNIEDIRNAFLRIQSAAQGGNTKKTHVISFMSAASGDGSSTLAMNTAYALANEYHMPTILIDMDYQFGMVAKSLDLSSPYGIKELFEHPDRAIDSTLVERMVVSYRKNLHVIAAPNELRFLPDVRPESIHDLIVSLSASYRCIVLDIPHLWSSWISAAFSNSTHIVLVAQLWLKSVTHASRLFSVWRNMGLNNDMIRVAINRSGAKFKEAVNPRDFERICGKAVDFYLPNDIKTVVNAENQGRTIIELGKSKLAGQILKVAEGVLPDESTMSGTPDMNNLLSHSTKRLG